MIQNRWIRWPISLAAGFLAIAITALILQQVIQGLAGIHWVIHWTETVPVIALFFATLINKRLATPT